MSHITIHYRLFSKKSAFPDRGLTLAELLVATTIVTVVFVALASASFVIRKLDANYSRDTTLYMQLASMGEDIRYSARQAAGTSSSYGILIGATGAPSSSRYMCFLSTPSAGNPWRCYSMVIDATDFYSCDRVDVNPCNVVAGVSNVRLLGKLDRDTFSGAGTYCPQPSFPGASDYNFRFTLIGRQDPTVGASPSCAAALNKGTADNPQEVISYTIYPEAHSF